MQATLHSAAPPDDASVYEALTDAGPLRLTLRASAGERPACAADAALRLVRAEPLLAALEAWLAQAQPPAAAPEWAWHDAPGGPRGSPAQARWVGTDVEACLALPWALLRRLPAPQFELPLQWSAVQAEWVLARLALTASEREALEPGGALLLPGSFAPGWPSELRAAQEANPPTVADAAPGALAGGACWEVCCALPSALLPQRLLGWDGAPPPFDDAAPLTLWCLVADRSPEPWAQGRCVPWGEGRAMLLDDVNAGQPSAA